MLSSFQSLATHAPRALKQGQEMTLKIGMCVISFVTRVKWANLVRGRAQGGWSVLVYAFCGQGWAVGGKQEVKEIM